MRELHEAYRISRHYGPVFGAELFAAIACGGVLILFGLMLVGLFHGAKSSVEVSAPRFVVVEARP